jgi:hypothetical protein
MLKVEVRGSPVTFAGLQGSLPAMLAPRQMPGWQRLVERTGTRSHHLHLQWSPSRAFRDCCLEKLVHAAAVGRRGVAATEALEGLDGVDAAGQVAAARAEGLMLALNGPLYCWYSCPFTQLGARVLYFHFCRRYQRLEI